jgi:zinc/manganese transport system substrate-binding protein
VVVSVNQWGDIAAALGGACAQVDTIVADSKVDPHAYEPTPADIASFDGAALVLVNGVGYDAWAQKAVAAVSSTATVVDAGAVNSVSTGSNPHLWYDPSYVRATARAITAALQELAPAATAYFRAQHREWVGAMAPYDKEIERLKTAIDGQSYGASETVFDYMATTVGLVNKTPIGYQQATANGSEPAPGDLDAFLTALRDRQMNVLVFNTQTSGAIPDQLKAAATSAGVPIVDVTETVPAGYASFQDWQVSQLKALAVALGIA